MTTHAPRYYLVGVNIGREEIKSGIIVEALPELLEKRPRLPGCRSWAVFPHFVRRKERT